MVFLGGHSLVQLFMVLGSSQHALWADLFTDGTDRPKIVLNLIVLHGVSL